MNRPFWVVLVTVLIVFAYFLLTTALLIWAERRVVARMQSRLGPNRVGPFGVLQTLVDGVKMFFKEDVTPAMVKEPIYSIAPLVAVVAGFLSIAVIPIGGQVTIAGETFPLQVADLGVGMLWFLAMGSLHVYATFLGGWASNSPYPLLGGVRSSAQMVSYEISQGLAVASVFIYTGSLRVSDIVAAQSGPGFVEGVPGWFIIPLFPAFLVFVVGMVAEAGRPPFDLAEDEGTLVGGFNTEYSGLRFGMFMLAEFMSVIIMSAVVVTLFLGGPAGPTFGLPEPFPSVLPIVWFSLKTAVFVFFFILLRGALPRTRYDRLMALGWKVLIPVGLVWVLVTGALVLIEQDGGLSTNARLGLVGGAVLIAVLGLATSRGEDTAVPSGAPARSTAARLPGPASADATDRGAAAASAAVHGAPDQTDVETPR
jgi:NADH-quinone oxidoreductase subunit H